LFEERHDLIGRLGDGHAGLAEGLLLALCRAPVARDDRPRVAHPLALGGGAAGDERHGLEPGAAAEELGRPLLVGAADLADDDEVRRLLVLLKERDHVAEGEAEHRVAADADDGRLAHAGGRQRRAHLVGQGAAARHQAHAPWRRDALRDDADLPGAGGDQAGAVGAEAPRRRVAAEEVLDPDHVLDRDALRDAHDERDARRGGLHDRVRRERRRHEDARRGRACLLDRLDDGVEHGHAEVRGSTLARRRAANELRPHLLHLPGVKGALAAGDALDDHARRGVEKDAHRVMATIFSAASHALAPGSMPCCWRIARPSSSWVPLMRTTRGSFIFRLSRAVTRPFATSSPRVMPPNTFISTPLTFGFMRMTASAFSTTSAFAPPPMSQKFAALPPARWTRSRVLMHRPAPLPMMPMSPSSDTYVRPRFFASTS